MPSMTREQWALARKLRALESRVELIQVLMKFLKRHPFVAEETVLWQLGKRVGLVYYDTAFIRPVWINGKPGLRLERYFLYEGRVLGRIGQFSIVGETDGSSVGGYVHAKRATLARARLGTTDLDKSVFLVKAPPENVLPGIDGYLGTDTLKARRIDFNFETNTLAWKR